MLDILLLVALTWISIKLYEQLPLFTVWIMYLTWMNVWFQCKTAPGCDWKKLWHPCGEAGAPGEWWGVFRSSSSSVQLLCWDWHQSHLPVQQEYYWECHPTFPQHRLWSRYCVLPFRISKIRSVLCSNFLCMSWNFLGTSPFWLKMDTQFRNLRIGVMGLHLDTFVPLNTLIARVDLTWFISKALILLLLSWN